MFKMHFFLVNAALLFIAFAVACAFPNGAPSCETGTAAPQSLHLDRGRDPLKGEISAEGYQVFIDEQEVILGTPTQVQVGEDHVLKIVSSTGAMFKGALVLLSKVSKDYSSTLAVSSDNFQLAPNCVGEPIAGITHVDRNFKKEFLSTLRLEENAKEIYLDVNIVPQNNKTRSIYYYNRFEIEAIGGSTDRKPVFKRCGLLGLSVVCPLSSCGWLGRILWMCKP